MKALSPFAQKVINSVLKIPRGKVATYGQIAKIAGKEHAPRGVAWILNSSSKKYKLPWHRVINSQGKISFHELSSNFILQKARLKKEGIMFDQTGKVDMVKFQWKAGLKQNNRLKRRQITNKS